MTLIHRWQQALLATIFALSSASALAAGNPDGAQFPDSADYQYVFDINALPKITMEISEEQWNVLLSSSQYDRPKANITRWTFEKDGVAQTLTAAKAKVSGNTSFVTPEVAGTHCRNCADWRQTNFNFDLKTETFRGLTGLKLKRFHGDPSYVREVAANDIMRKFGIFTTHHSTYARLYVHVLGDAQPAYFGVYRMNEDINELEFITNRFGAANLTDRLWKMSYSSQPGCSGPADLTPITVDRADKMSRDDCVYEYKGKKATFDAAKVQFVDFLNAINSKSGADFKAYADASINTDLLLKGIAAEAALGHWDGMGGNFNNYYMYFDKAGVMQFIPYDMDNILGTSAILADAGRADLLKWGTNVLVKKMLSIPEYKAQYLANLQQLVTDPELLTAERANWIKTRHNLIKNHISNDTGDNMSYADRPASWGNQPSYRIFDLASGTNFYAVKKAAVDTAVANSSGFAKVFNQLYFRGTPNGWKTTAMNLVDNNTWQVQAAFGAEVNPRFKVDVNGDWGLNFGDTNNDKVLDQSGADIKVSNNKTYLITINDQTRGYSVVEANLPNQAPVANAGVDVTVLVGQSVLFNGFGSTDSDGQIVSYFWSNGITAPSGEFVYLEPGVYTETLTVTDDDGALATDTVVITVVDNYAPVANAGADITAVVGADVVLDGSASSDANGGIVSYEWSNGLSGSMVTTSFDAPGTYTLTLTVTDDQGATATDTVVVTVTDGTFTKVFPQLNFRGTANAWGVTPMQLVANNTWQLQVAFNEVDPRFKLDLGSDWVVNYGDTNNDKVLDQGGPSIKVTNNKTYIITVNDLTRAYTLTEVRVNQAPVANAGADITVEPGQQVTLNAGSSSDVDGSIVSYNWSNGLSGQVVTTSFATEGTYSINLTVTDNEGATATDSVIITVRVKPATVDVTFTCNNGTTVVGQNVYVVGNLAQLGGWNSANAIKLSPTAYPRWTGTIALPPSTAVQWKCIKRDVGSVVWQGGSNNSFTSVSSGTQSVSASF